MIRPPLWFRLFLRLLPADFRADHGEDICALAARYTAGRGAVGRSLVWARAALDLVTVSVRTRAGTLDGMGRDVRYAVRSLRRDIGFAAFAITIVGLGIGASVTVFSVARALLLRPLPFDEPERLVWISNGEFGRGQRLSSISVQSGQLEPLRTTATQFADVGGYNLFDDAGDRTLRIGDRARRATRLRVTENFFDVLGVEPLVGRLFAPGEVIDDGPRTIVLPYEAWQRLFAGRDVVGTVVEIDGAGTTIIGILPPAFDFGEIFAPGSRIDYVAGFPLSARSNRSGNTLGLVGRLADGATLTSAQAEAEALVRTDGMNDFHPVVRPLRDHLSGGFRPTVALLAASVTLVMLMVCANLSNLLLARGAARARELSIRAAIGAGRARLVQQLLTESLILGLGGAVLGLVLAFNGTRWLASLDLRIPMLGQTRVDGTALALAVGASLVVALLFGVAPALRGTDVEPQSSLKEGSRGTAGGRGHTALRQALVVSQVAIACLLLVASTLTARSLVHLVETDLGYDPSGVVALRIDPSARFPSNADRLAYYGSVLAGTRAAPGVDVAGVTDMLPMSFNRRWSLRIDERPDDRTFPYVRVVSEGYAPAMGLEIVAGRDLTEADGPDAAPVGLVNEVLARQMWGDADPLGRRATTSGREFEVVGIVRSTRQLSVDQAPGPELFLPLRQLSDHGSVYVVVRGERPAAELLAQTREAVRAVDPAVPTDAMVRLEAVVATSLAPKRFLVYLLGGFALFALALAALGIYAVISYAVAHRRREIGIRVALGATSARVMRRLLRESLVLTAMGLAVGLAAAIGASGALQTLLHGVAATDRVTLVSVALLLTVTSVAASWIPARRALRVSPLDAVTGESHATG